MQLSAGMSSVVIMRTLVEQPSAASFIPVTPRSDQLNQRHNRGPAKQERRPLSEATQRPLSEANTIR